MVLNVENPNIDEIMKQIFKEANKQGSNIETSYKVCAMRCLSDLVQFSSNHFKDTYFEQYWLMFILKFFEQDLIEIKRKEILRYEQQIENLKAKNQFQEQETESESDRKMDESELVVGTKDEKMEIDKEEEEKNTILKLVCLETIGKCWSYATDIQGNKLLNNFTINLCTKTTNFLSEKYLYDATLILADNLNKVAWTNQISIIKSFGLIFDKYFKIITFLEKNKLNA